MDLTERPTSTSLSTRHPWEVARAQFFCDVVENAVGTRSVQRVLDVGAGDAYVAQAILERMPSAHVVAYDAAYTGDELDALNAGGAPATARDDGAGPRAAEARPRHGSALRLEAVRELPRGPFDVALLLDVLEHVDDDRAFLATVSDTLAPDGAAIISVPAWPRLMSGRDIKLRHRRRYTPARMRSVIEACGLRVERGGGLFHSLLAPRAVDVVVRNKLGLIENDAEIARWRAGSALTALVTGALKLDTALSRALARVRLDVPGLSWWGVCRRAR